MFFKILCLKLWLMFGHLRTFMLREFVAVKVREQSLAHHAHFKAAEVLREAEDLCVLDTLIENPALYAGILAVAVTAITLENGD